MLNCKQIVKIVSSEDKPSWRQRLEVRFHLLMCHHCRKYTKHLEIMKNGFKEFFKESFDKGDQGRNMHDLENKIISKIKHGQGK